MYVVTGAGGQLGRALAEEFSPDGVTALTRSEWDVELPPPAGLEPPDVVLHAAAWTNVDGAESDPQGAAAVNVGGTANVAALGAPLVYYSTDYVFDGRCARCRTSSRTGRIRSPPTGGRSSTARRPRASERGSSAPRGCSARRATTSSARCCGSARSGTRSRSSTTSGGRRPTSATSPPRRVRSCSCPTASTTSPPTATRRGPTSPRRSSRRRVSRHRVRRITTAELARPAPRPAYSVLRSEKGAPTLPHWREGLRETIAAIRAGAVSE